MKFKLFIWMICLTLLIGCGTAQVTEETQPTKIVSAVVIPTPSKNIVSTIIPTEPSRSSENWEVTKKCATVYPSRPSTYQLIGVAAVRSLSSKVLGLDMSLLNLENGEFKKIDTANQSVWDADISPDREALAYQWFNIATEKWELLLINGRGEPQKVAWSSGDDFGFGGWLNDHQLLNYKRYGEDRCRSIPEFTTQF